MASKKTARKKAGPDLWEKLARAETHPLRVSILEVLSIDGGRTISPVELAFELQENLGLVNYHVGELHGAGILRLDGEEQVRGAMKHFYCLACNVDAFERG